MGKQTNPLYAVTNKGKDVQEVGNYLELLVTKLGLTPVIEFIEEMLKFLFEQISSYAMFVMVKEYLDQVVNTVEQFLSQLDPVWASFFPAALEGWLGKKGDA
jgi:phage-related protein